MSADLQLLERLAREATQGEWFLIPHADPGDWSIQDREEGLGRCIAQRYEDSPSENGAYIAAMNPKTALELIEEIKRLRAKVEELNDYDDPEDYDWG